MASQKSPSPVTTAAFTPDPESNGVASAPAPSTMLKSLAAEETSLESTIGSPFKRTRAGDEKDVDVSGAKRASEVFSNTLFAGAGKIEDNLMKETDPTIAEEL